MKRVVLALAVIAVMVPGSAYPTNGMRMIGFGASQVAMGGAAVALPLDAASVVVNPAGMNELGSRIDFGASYFKPTVKYQASESPGLGPMTGAIIGRTAEQESSRGASPVPAFGFVLPVVTDLWFGMGAYGICGMGVDYPQNLYGGITYTNYSQLRFAPGLSYKISDQLSVGATVNIAWATMSYDVASGFGQAPHNVASSFGYGGTIGIHYSPMPWFTVAAAYESKSTFQDFKFNIPARTVPDGTPTGMSMPAGVDKLTFDQPQSVTFGFATNPHEPLTLAFDVQWINWSQTNGKDLPQYSQSNAAQPWNMNWNDQWVFKVGVQYRVLPMLALRAGYNYGKNPLDASRAFENIAFPAVAEHHVTGGVGIDFNKSFGLNLAFMYAPEAKVSGSNPTPPPGGQLIAQYQTTMSQYAIDGSIAYHF